MTNEFVAGLLAELVEFGTQNGRPDVLDLVKVGIQAAEAEVPGFSRCLVKNWPPLQGTGSI